MVQAIQVLRFHLLELEKVSTYNFKYLVLVRRTKWNTFGRKPVGWISRNTTTSRFIGGLDSEPRYRCATGRATPSVRILNFENNFGFERDQVFRREWERSIFECLFFVCLPFGSRGRFLAAVRAIMRVGRSA